ncbi:MAG: PP0621 family protein [Betaproteobacteria bacterium]|nr:PP0621 family protein [Betaproteobacteria bacterium]
MAKILLIAVAFAAAWWLLRRHRRRVREETPPPAASGAEDMVRCAGCGVHLPRGDSIESQKLFFCSSDHEREYRRSR